jgi:hypothetical protein
MYIDYSVIIDFVVLGVLILFFIADEILRATWNKKYFTIGLPIYVIHIPVDLTHTNLPADFLLEIKFHSGWIEPIVFKELGPNVYGFRNGFFNFSWFRTSSLMHGLLIFDHNHKQVVVKGFARWSFIYISLLTFIIIIRASISNPLPAVILLACYFLFAGLSYSLQSYRFSQVAKFAAQSWSRKYMPESDTI